MTCRLWLHIASYSFMIDTIYISCDEVALIAEMWPDGARYCGQWVRDKAHGQGRFEHVDGDVRHLSVLLGIASTHGLSPIFSSFSSISMEFRVFSPCFGRFRSFHGTSKGISRRRKVYEGQWQADKAHGQGMSGAEMICHPTSCNGIQLEG